MSKSIFIGITTYNDHGYLPLLLWTIRHYTCDYEYELVVCDDGSPDEACVQNVKTWCEEYSADLIRHEENRGISAAWNTLSNEAISRKCKTVVLISNDLLVVPHWLRCLLYGFQANEQQGVVGSLCWLTRCIPPCFSVAFMGEFHRQLHKYVLSSERVIDAYSARLPEDKSALRETSRRLAPLGSAFAFTAETLKRVGPFDERFQGSYNDMDFGVRCARLNRWSFLLPYPKLYHAFSRTYINNPSLLAARRRDAGMKLICEKWALSGLAGYAYLHEQFVERFTKTPTSDEQSMMFLQPTGTCRETACADETVLLPVLQPALYKVGC